MAVQIDADARPVKARRNLLDMGGFPRSVIALNHHAAVIFETHQNCLSCFRIELIALINLWNIFRASFECRNFHLERKIKNFFSGYSYVGHFVVVCFRLWVISSYMDIIDRIKAALKANYNPEQLEIVDESYQHAGHAGHGEYSHLLIKISFAPFKEMSRLERTRKLMKDIYGAAGKEIHSVRFEFI